MSVDILKRTTYIVANAKTSAKFYCDVFGWKIWYDNVLEVDERFPPSGAANNAKAHLIILEVLDSKIGKLGLLQYLEPPFDTGVSKNRTKVRMGESVLVVETEDVDAVHERAVAAGANVVTPPVDWNVPTADGASSIHLRTISLFDPNGIYLEVSSHP